MSVLSAVFRQDVEQSFVDLCGVNQLLMRYMAALLAVSGAAAVRAQAPAAPTLDQAVGFGLYYADDNFGGAVNTEILYAPISYDLDYGRWGLRVLGSGLQVTGPGNVLVNVGGVTQAVAGDQITREAGAGDTLLSAVYRLDPVTINDFTLPFIDLRVDAKLPSADERRGLGTGEWDYSVQIDLSQNVGSTALFASIGHTFRGQTSLYPGLRDSSYLQAGFARNITSNWSGGVFYDYREQASDFAVEIHELVPYASVQLSQRWSLTGLLSFGFTQASADRSALLQLGYRW